MNINPRGYYGHTSEHNDGEDYEINNAENEEEWVDGDTSGPLAIENGDEHPDPAASNPPGDDLGDDDIAPSSKYNKSKSRERYSSSYSSVKHLPAA